MKITFLMPHLGVYGGVRRIVELTNRLVQMGHQVTIYHTDGSPCSWIECQAQIRPAFDIVNEVHEILIYSSPTKFELDLTSLARAKRKIYFCLGFYDTELMLPGINIKKLFFWKGATRPSLLLKKGMLDSDLLLANATWMKKWLEENLGLECIVLLGGVNTEMFYPVPVAKDSNIIRILYSGDPRLSKGTQIVESACKMVQAQLPNVVLETYYGKGISQSKMAQVYCAADIFVDGQISAGWNNPVAEAMACNVPVVCTNIGGVQDFAFHEQTALLVSPKDIEGMAEAILRLIRDSELRQRLSENAFQQIQTFKWDESAAKLEGILENALKQPPVKQKGHRPEFAKSVERFWVRVLWLSYHKYLSTLPKGSSRIRPLGFLRFAIRRWMAGTS
jgi:O-antigen biosynthesis protein